MTAPLELLQGLFPAACHDRVFLTGGSVRDLLLSRPGADLDLAAALPPPELRRLGFTLVQGKSTTPVWLRTAPPHGKIELTPLRTDAPLEEELDADLRRRDFTVNAMALGLDGTLHDPLGGRDDLAAGRLRACRADAFHADPLRLLRALRFECAGWRLDAASEALIRGDEWGAPLRAIPVERCSRELLKALTADSPQRFPARLVELGLGRDWLPELSRMAAVPAGPPRHHGETSLLEYSLEVLERLTALSADPLARFCALFHDLGKLATEPSLYPRHHGHDQAGFALAPAFCTRLALPAAYRRGLAWSCRLHTTVNRWEELRDTTRISLIEQAERAAIAGFLPLLAAADKAERGPPQGWAAVLEIVRLNTAALGIAPAQLAALAPPRRAALIRRQRIAELRRRGLGRTRRG